MAGHTPGPWTAVRRCVGAGPNDDERFGLGWDVDGPEPATNRGQFARASDARLIAAAPDLLAACVGMAERLEEYVAELDRDKMHGEANNVGRIAATLRAAAAKAIDAATGS